MSYLENFQCVGSGGIQDIGNFLGLRGAKMLCEKKCANF